MCRAKMQRSFAEELYFFFFFLHSLFTRVCAFLSEVCPLFLPPRKRMNLVVFFLDDYFTYICYTVYIHNVYKHYEQYIYYTYIFVHTRRVSCTMARICLSIALIYFALFFYFSREYNKDLLIM